MNRRVRNILTGFLAVCALTAAAPAGGFLSYAASARISFSDPSTTVGQEFNVTVKISSQDGNLGASDVMLSYDPAYIQFVNGDNASGGGGSIRLVGTMNSSSTTEFSHTLKFKALQAGNTTISVADSEIYDVDTQVVNVTKKGSSAVQVNAPATYSSEAALSSLKVSPGQLSPAFSPEVTAYSVNVGGDVSKLAVSANPKDGKARVLVNGDSGLLTGSNTVVCKVTAEDGQTTRSYTITVNKSKSGETLAEMPAEAGAEAAEPAQLGEQTVERNGITYRVAASFDPALLPEGYAQSVCTYGGAEVMCGSGNGIDLLYFQSEDGNGAFFVYLPETGTVAPYVTINVTAKSLLVLPPDETVEVPAGFAPVPVKITEDCEVDGWVWQSDPEQKYCVVYGMNENGEKGLYRFDIAEKTFQRYFQDPAIQSRYDDAAVEELQEQYNSLCRDYNIRFIIIIALIAACLILFFIVINLLMHQKERSEQERSMREEAPTPVKRRAMEEERRRKQEESSRYGMSERRRAVQEAGGEENGRPEYRGGSPAARAAGVRENAAFSGRTGYREGSVSQGRSGYQDTRVSSDYNVYRDGAGPAKSPVRRDSAEPAKTPVYRDSAGSGKTPVYRDSAGSGKTPVYRDGAGSGKTPVYRDSAGPGKSPVYRDSRRPAERTVYQDGRTAAGRAAYPDQGRAANSKAGRDSRRPGERVGAQGSASLAARPTYQGSVSSARGERWSSNESQGRLNRQNGGMSCGQPDAQAGASYAGKAGKRPENFRGASGRNNGGNQGYGSAGPRPADKSGSGSRETGINKARGGPVPVNRTGGGRNSGFYGNPSSLTGEGAVRRREASPYGGPGRSDAGMEEVIRQRQLEREERSKRTRERLEQARMEDRRAQAARLETAAGMSRIPDEDDFEILDLN